MSIDVSLRRKTPISVEEVTKAITEAESFFCRFELSSDAKSFTAKILDGSEIEIKIDISNEPVLGEPRQESGPLKSMNEYIWTYAEMSTKKRKQMDERKNRKSKLIAYDVLTSFSQSGGFPYLAAVMLKLKLITGTEMYVDAEKWTEKDWEKEPEVTRIFEKISAK